MIKAAGYDTVLVATGAEPVVSKMKGADASNVFNILTSYSNKKALGENVVVIGAGKIRHRGCNRYGEGRTQGDGAGKRQEMVEPEFVGAHNMTNQQDIYTEIILTSIISRRPQSRALPEGR